jgi:asparagine synthase (glutamine-hydrolysing)
MCGIAGFFFAHQHNGTQAAWQSRLQEASARMQLRGPDGSGTYCSHNIGLAHRRLAIIDLDGGKQPFTDPESGFTLVFNGEIYNYRELRQELGNLGYTFQSHSDTETLLIAYRHWGKDCLERLKGMFAFAIYNPAAHQLFLARDRLGVKPLFWMKTSHGLCFASSVAALLAFKTGAPDLDHDAISHYLTTIRVNLGSRTLLKEIQLLDPGHFLIAQKNGSVEQRQYWTPTILAPADKPDLDTITKQDLLRQSLDQAVQRRLISDVPLGGFLSGGLDSSIIAARATRFTANQYHAYSVGYDQPDYNEFPFITEAAHFYQMKCRQIRLSPDSYPGQWQFLIRQNGLPTTTPNEIPILDLSKALREEYTVALSGEGADEIFGGYTIAYFAGHDFDRSAHDVQAASGHPFASPAQRAYGQPYIPSLAWQHLQLNHWLSPSEKARWLHPDINKTSQHDEAIRQYYTTLYETHPDASTLDKILYAHLRINLEGLLLRVDSSSMAASVEARVPFTDHELVNLAFSLPDSDKLAWRSPEAQQKGKNLNVLDIVNQDLIISKRILREAYHDAVPPSILLRPKMSFPVPVFAWMSDWMRPMIRSCIGDSPLRNTLFNPETVDHFLRQPEAFHPLKIWPILNLCLWQQTLQSGAQSAPADAR